MKRICWESGISTWGAAGSVIEQEFHGGHAGLHGKESREIISRFEQHIDLLGHP